MKKILLSIIFVLLALNIYAEDEKKDSKMESSTFSGLKWRSIGPAWNSGRVSDFAVNPNNINEYYVAASSGNLWKTTNNGITWEAIGDTLPYSLGVVELDPNNYHVVWVGSGENNHQRALGYGDGVYKSTDGGKSFTNMGLRESRQIGEILIDPRNSDVVYVAAEGSVWGPGGERGCYKTTDGGKTWKKVLEISKHTGVNSMAFDLRSPDVIYATSEQRRRHAFTKIGGGPESAVYKSVDAGVTWNKIMSGLPDAHIGGMDITVSAANPDYVYLSMEASKEDGGFYRSTNRGANWTKMSDKFAQGQYFNEIFCDPIDVDKVYLMDVFSVYTEDGGKTWEKLGVKNRHVDDHVLWINPNNTDHLLIGGDGGVYESYDTGEHWEFKANLPVTQFYRVNVDNEYPFYNVYGGTQDNQSMGGPSQTLTADGIVNSDWFMTVGGDGFFQEIDPTDPNIVYSEWQYGNIVRYDKKSEELLLIRPEPGRDEKTYKWYWDTPFLISPHAHTRLYIAAERVFKSEDRGESWEVISGDLTTQTDRNSFKVMDKYWSADAVMKDVSTSQYGLIVAMAESPIKENLIFIGTDDGLIQVTADAKNWKKISGFPDVPKFTFVSDILPSRYDENVVYATFNNHKMDDFKPYVLKSSDKGNSWESIAGDLPNNGAVNTIVEDPINKNLLFVGTEWGVFFSVDGGGKWIQLKNGLPRVKVPDIVIQEREKDLVIATFGRGFYILDDYSPLRTASKEMFDKEAHLFPISDALMYHMKGKKYGQGSAYFKAPNPEFGAVFTYYLNEVPKTLKQLRTEKEKELFEKGERIPQPSYDEIRIENDEVDPYLMFSITDELGNEVKKITTAAKAGISRVVWDLKYDHIFPIKLKDNKFNPTPKPTSSLLALPGKYNVAMYLVSKGEAKKLTEPEDFNAVVLNNTTLPAADRTAKVEFERKALKLASRLIGLREQANDAKEKLDLMKQTAITTAGLDYSFIQKIDNVTGEVDDILFKFKGQPAKASLEEIPPATVPLNWRIDHMVDPTWESTASVTKNQKVAYEILSVELPGLVSKLKKIVNEDLKSIEAELDRYGAPWTPGRILPKK